MSNHSTFWNLHNFQSILTRHLHHSIAPLLQGKYDLVIPFQSPQELSLVEWYDCITQFQNYKIFRVYIFSVGSKNMRFGSLKTKKIPSQYSNGFFFTFQNPNLTSTMTILDALAISKHLSAVHQSSPEGMNKVPWYTLDIHFQDTDWYCVKITRLVFF